MAKISPKNNIKYWVADSLDKVFYDTPRPGRADKSMNLHAAAGETVSGQVCLRTEGLERWGFGIDGVSNEPLKTGKAGMSTQAIELSYRWVGHTYVPESARGVDPDHLEGRAPGLYPDPLYPVYEPCTRPHHFNPDHSMVLPLNQTKALWVTVRVACDATPGIYRTAISLKTAFYGYEIRIPFTIQVYPVVLPEERKCGIENWFAMASVARQHQCEWWSELFWEYVGVYLENLGNHRQTHIVVPMFELMQFSARAGKLRINWTRFDRFVELAINSGLTDLVGNHLATYTYEYERKVQCGVHTYQIVADKVEYQLFEGRTKKAEEWLTWFLPRLRRHLKAKGWLSRWWQHIRDEPGQHIVDDYRNIHRLVKKHAPEFRTIEAMHGPIVDQCDCWVPGLAQWHQDREFFEKRQQKGDQVWTYVCCGPVGKYANRFIDQKALLPRLLFWIMAKYGAQGYLHWGYNWTAYAVPEVDTTYFLPAQGAVQSGDTCVVYPGPNGPHDSIRWEMQLEGVQDYELLNMLKKKAPEKTLRILGTVIRDFDDYELDVKTFRKVRSQLLKALSDGG